jgi:phenylacetate-coenzyme A ligase PaaK-like adenylate-forming protein
MLQDASNWLRALWEHRRAMGMSREKLEAEQLRKFRRLVAHAQSFSPFWRRVIAENGIDPRNCHVEDFPTLTKKMVVDNFEELVTDRRITRSALSAHFERDAGRGGLFLGEYHVVQTSGTSGMPLFVLYSRRDWIRGASLVTCITPPFRLRMRTAYIASTKSNSTGASLVKSGTSGLNRLLFNVRLFEALTPLAELIAELNCFQPHCLSGYATMMRLLAEAQLRGELRIRPTHVSCGAELLTEEARALIEKAFGVPAHNAYACTEHLYLGLSFPPEPGLRLMEDELIIELRQDHTCITNLFNQTMPLIRYRMEDVLMLEDAPGAAGLPFRRVKELVGREEKVLRFTNDLGAPEYIHPFVLLQGINAPGLVAWQAALTGPASLTIRLLIRDTLTPAERDSVIGIVQEQARGMLADMRMTRVQVTTEQASDLSIDPRTRKFRLVVDETKNAV